MEGMILKNLFYTQKADSLEIGGFRNFAADDICAFIALV